MIDKIVSQAPARVCLFGDHQDYLRLPIIATTINNSISVNEILKSAQQEITRDVLRYSKKIWESTMI